MLEYLYLFDPRYWINRWRITIFFQAFGPDIATVISRELKFEDIVDESLKNWQAEATARLPYRYRQLIERIHKDNYPISIFELVSHKCFAFNVIDGLIYYESYLKKVRPDSPKPERFLWQMYPECFVSAPEDLRARFSEFEADFREVVAQRNVAMFLYRKLPEIRAHSKQNGGT